MTASEFIDYTGVIVFAMSGLLAAGEKKLDLFGGLVIAFVTALGGGTLRDTLLQTPISWIYNPLYIYLVIAGASLALIFRPLLRKIRKTLFLFDSLGIALFTIFGVQKTLEMNLPVAAVLIFGVVTATFGGVIRDILCNDIPLIFRKEIYATACLIGAIIYLGLSYIIEWDVINMIISCSIVLGIRTVAVIKKYRFPILNEKF